MTLPPTYLPPPITAPPGRGSRPGCADTHTSCSRIRSSRSCSMSARSLASGLPSTAAPRGRICGWASAAGRGRHESASTRQRSRHRDTCARILRPRRRHAAAGDCAATGREAPTARRGRQPSHAVQTDAGRPLHAGERYERARQSGVGGAQSAVWRDLQLLPAEASSTVQLTIRDASGREVQTSRRPLERRASIVLCGISLSGHRAPMAQSRRRVVDVDAVERGAEEAPGCERCRARTRCN